MSPSNRVATRGVHLALRRLLASEAVYP